MKHFKLLIRDLILSFISIRTQYIAIAWSNLDIIKFAMMACRRLFTKTENGKFFVKGYLEIIIVHHQIKFPWNLREILQIYLFGSYTIKFWKIERLMSCLYAKILIIRYYSIPHTLNSKCLPGLIGHRLEEPR